MTGTTSPSQSQVAGQAADIRVPTLVPSRFLGRQPILEADGHLFGYELLFRAGQTDGFSGDAETATREVIDHWLMLIPDGSPCSVFVNCTRTTLTEGFITLLPPENTVLEIPATLEPDPTLIEACVSLKERGYRIALDAFVPQISHAPFLESADFIKIDFLASEFQVRQEIYSMAAGCKAKLIAEKIETEWQMRIAHSEGCSLFQGYYFSQPVLISSHVVPQNHVVYLQLIAALHEEPTDLHKIEKLLAGEPSLCYRLLRIANSAMHGRRGVVTTVRDALMMVGDNAVRRMVTAAMAGVLSARRSEAVVSMALTRARFCELLAPAVGEEPAQLYLLGMISLLDVLLETPLHRILETLPISTTMKSALAGDNSTPGLALELIRNLESCDWQRCDQLQYSLSLPEGTIAPKYVEALHWAASMVGD